MTERSIPKLVDRLGECVVPNALSLAIAESCTGGQLCGAIVSNPEVSGALERGFIVYSLDAKCELLDLERDEVERCQGVSVAVATGMARAALQRSHADISVAITGFAGPSQDGEEVGLVHIATASGDSTQHRELHLGDPGRDEVCRRSVMVALEMLIEAAQEAVRR